MKFVHPEINTVFDLENGKINTLIIENPSFFFRLLTDISTQINGGEGTSVLSVENSIVDFPHHAEILDGFISFELNRKTLLTKITSALEKEALSPEYYEDSMQCLQTVESFLNEVCFAFPCDIVFSKLTVGSLIKSCSPELRDAHTGLADKIIDYFELVGEFDRKKTFFTVNLRSYINDNDYSLFAETVISHGYQVLMIENHEKERISNERRVIIDSDLCEIC